jgi:hypothetical protein
MVVKLLEAFGYGVDLVAGSISRCGPARLLWTYLGCFFFHLFFFPLCLLGRVAIEDGQPRVGG